MSDFYSLYVLSMYLFVLIYLFIYYQSIYFIYVCTYLIFTMVQWLAMLLHICESCHLNIGSEASYSSSQILRCILKHKMTSSYIFFPIHHSQIIISFDGMSSIYKLLRILLISIKNQSLQTHNFLADASFQNSSHTVIETTIQKTESTGTLNQLWHFSLSSTECAHMTLRLCQPQI